MKAFVARFASTPIDEIGAWSPEKLTRHFETALRLHKILEGKT